MNYLKPMSGFVFKKKYFNLPNMRIELPDLVKSRLFFAKSGNLTHKFGNSNILKIKKI